MAYIDIYAPATDATHVLRKQVAVAIFKAAVDVSNEAANTANHSNRLTWARRVLRSNNGPIDEASSMIWKVLENTTIQAALTTSADATVQNAVNSVIDIFANR